MPAWLPCFHRHSFFAYLNPTIGYCLQPLHLAWCRAVSAAAKRWSTGSQTKLCGSCRSQFKKCDAWISRRPAGAAISKQLRTLGSMLEPPKAAISPRSLGICTQSWSRRPSCRSSAQPLPSAMSRNRSEKWHKPMKTVLVNGGIFLGKKCPW